MIDTNNKDSEQIKNIHIRKYKNRLRDSELDKKSSPNEDGSLTEGEKVMLELFRAIPEDQQQVVLAMIRAALCTGK